MTKYTLSIGLNDKDTKKQRISTIEAYKIIENIIIKRVGGGSIFEGRGIYKHDDGQIIVENSLLVEIFEAKRDQVLEVAENIKTALNQEHIIMANEEINSELI